MALVKLPMYLDPDTNYSLIVYVSILYSNPTSDSFQDARDELGVPRQVFQEIDKVERHLEWSSTIICCPITRWLLNLSLPPTSSTPTKDPS